MHRPFISALVLLLLAAGHADANEAPAKASLDADALKAAYADCFAIGAAVPGADISDPERQLLLSQFNALTPEYNMKAKHIHPEEDRYDFAPADALVEMARSNGLEVNAHTLIWHDILPDWFFVDGNRPASRAVVLKRMREHIVRVAGHFAGKVKSWDVVNEALDDGGPYLRETPWLKSIGEEYIAEAFIAARRADPNAELYYNDYLIELPWKRGKALRLIRNLKQRSVKLDGIGIQGHWELDDIPYAHIEDAIEAFAAEGLKVMITELDIDVVPRKPNTGGEADKKKDPGPYVNGLPTDVQKRLADQYAKLFALFRKHSDKISRVTFWGLHDGRTWLNYWPTEHTNHPLLWDRQLQPKPALAKVLEMAKQSPPCRPLSP